jgi:hypothetical protein
MSDYDDSIAADQSKKGWLTSILELGAWSVPYSAALWQKLYQESAAS